MTDNIQPAVSNSKGGGPSLESEFRRAERMMQRALVAEAEVERLRKVLAYEHTHTLDDATKHRIGEALDA